MTRSSASTGSNICSARYTGEDGQPFYHDGWATDQTSERASFESFVDFVIARRERHPDLHVYHYAPTSRPRSSA